MQLSIIIVSYNVKYYLEQCLCSVLTACQHLDAEIIVIDNASEDGSLDYLSAIFPRVIFIQNQANTGFAKANNKALLTAKGKYILYLNPDTIIPQDILQNCLLFLNKNSAAGAAGVKMLDGTGRFLPESKRSFPSVGASFFKLSGLAALFPYSAFFNKYAAGHLEENTIHRVEVLSGAFLICSRDILLSLNGFDEDFFMYGEDIDLSYRLEKAGYKNFYLGTNCIIHFKGESTKNDKNYVKNFYEAMVIFVRKHYKKQTTHFIKPAICIAGFLALCTQKLNAIFYPGRKQEHKAFILWGTADAVASAASILEADHYVYTVVTGNTEKVNQLLFEKTPGTLNLVFCLDEQDCTEYIQFIENNREKFAYYWHYKQTKSIVSGSNAAAIPQIYLCK